MKISFKWLAGLLLRPIAAWDLKYSKFQAYSFRDGMLAAIDDAAIDDQKTLTYLHEMADLMYEQEIKYVKDYWDKKLGRIPSEN